MLDRETYKIRAKNALNKKPAYGPDLDIREFLPRGSIDRLDLKDYADFLETIGIDVTEKDRSGSYYQLESSIISAYSHFGGVEVLPLEEALDRYGDFLKDYFWRAVSVDADKFTAIAELRGRGGYFIRVKKNVKVPMPIQTCLLMNMHGSLQAPHNIIVAEKGSEVNILTGCATMRETVGLHAGVTEIYVGENARVHYVMIHRWSEAMHIRPRTGVIVGRGGTYISNYIAFTKLKTFQSLPRVVLHDNAKAYLASIVALEGKSLADSGYHLVLKGEGSSGQIISRSLTKDESQIVARGIISGSGINSKGHIDCQGLLLSKSSIITAVPILEALIDNITLTHEAAVGKLSEDEILWLIARGFSREEAESILIRGFMKTDIPGLPDSLRTVINQTINVILASATG